MYPTYPTGGVPNQMPGRPPRPQTVSTAVTLMWVATGLTALGIILGFIALGSLKKAIIKADPAFTTHQIHAAESIAIAFAVVVGLIEVGLWVWMAWANGAGKNWARILSTVFFGIDTLLLLIGFARPHAILGSLFSILVWLLGLAIIVLLWRKESTAYFQPQ
ncbi:MAG TPA: hypothetical protein VMA95_15135 [Streptosporangiaceae bacterium]|nr:hypothetical protein [Streptosporangiaceae bacterium]